MRNLFRRALQSAGLYLAWKQLGHYPDFLYWKLRGRPPRSPHLLKQRTVLEYAQRFGVRTLIEAGTYYGEMVAAVRESFAAIYSIEYDSGLAELARRKFAKFPHIHILNTDSQLAIPELLKTVQEPCLFWLDAGYYGWAGAAGNPERLMFELQAILQHAVRGHVILIDDARWLNGTHGSPRADVLANSIQSDFPRCWVEVRDDIVRIAPRP